MRYRIAKDTKTNGGIDLLPASQIREGVNFFRVLFFHFISNGVRDLAKANPSHNLARVINELSEILRFAQDDTCK